jgi:CDP-diacylglycerol---serine O-phosphatidyltransferase
MKKHIPNLFTLLNICGGCLAIFFSFNNEFLFACICILLSAIFDFLDGFLAKRLNAQSEIGAQLDSLADMVTFGLAPSFIVLNLVNQDDTPPYYLLFLLFIPLNSAVRLARFNLKDPSQSTDFIGLPTPANALFIISISLLFFKYGDDLLIPYGNFIYVGLLSLSSFLMVSKISFMSFKVKTMSFSANKHLYVLLALVFLTIIISLLMSKYYFILPIILLLYFIISIIKNSKDEV